MFMTLVQVYKGECKGKREYYHLIYNHKTFQLPIGIKNIKYCIKFESFRFQTSLKFFNYFT